MTQNWQVLHYFNHVGYRLVFLLSASVVPLGVPLSASYAVEPILTLSQASTPIIEVPESPQPETPAVIETPTPDPIPSAPSEPVIEVPGIEAPAPVPAPAPAPAPAPEPAPEYYPPEPAPEYYPPEPAPEYYPPAPSPEPGYYPPAPAPTPTPSPVPTLPPKSVRQSLVVTPPADATLSTIDVGGIVVPGVLGESDYQVQGRRVDFYQFEGEANQNLVAILRNSGDDRVTNRLTLTPYMLVFDPNGQVVAGTIVPAQYRVPSRDPLQPLDNQLFLKLPQSGRYTIAVFADPNQTGRYGLSVKRDERIYQVDETNELTDASPVLASTGTPSMTTEIKGEAGQRLRIAADSYQFDPRLILVDENGTVVAEDDDHNGNFNALIDITLPASGTYQAIVVPADGSGRGSYRLTVY